MINPYTQYEQEVMTALYKSLNFCEENDLPTYEITSALSFIEDKFDKKRMVWWLRFQFNGKTNILSGIITKLAITIKVLIGQHNSEQEWQRKDIG